MRIRILNQNVKKATITTTLLSHKWTHILNVQEK